MLLFEYNCVLPFFITHNVSHENCNSRLVSVGEESVCLLEQTVVNLIWTANVVGDNVKNKRTTSYLRSTAVNETLQN